jgi:2'-5' RNA ligase
MRTQLSLYVPASAATGIEAVRRLLDPVQSRLIPAHVTLCREDELARVSRADLQSRLADFQRKPITLLFGRPEVFDGHGVLLPCIGGEEGFRSLREHVLGSKEIRRQAPHITLAHPRNPRSPNNIPSNTAQLPAIIEITFFTVSLIEQAGGEPWTLIQAFEMPARLG